MMANIDPTNDNNLAEESQLSDQEQFVKQATDEVMDVFEEQIQSLDKIVTSYWRQMVQTKAEMHNLEFQNEEIQEQHEEEVRTYKKEIEELKEKLKVAEAALLERDEEIKKLRGSNPPGLA
jgi:hypothetical protein